MRSFKLATLVLCGLFAPAALAGGGGKHGHGAAPAQFAAMDANSDGKVSADEHAAAARKMFETMDSNKDGKVTAVEMDAAHEKVTGKKAKPAMMTAADKIKVVDTNNDGVLTSEEHVAGSRTMFEKMDTDKDGTLTKNELKHGHGKMMHGHQDKDAKK